MNSGARQKRAALIDLNRLVGEEKLSHYHWTIDGTGFLGNLRKIFNILDDEDCWERFTVLANRCLILRQQNCRPKGQELRVGLHGSQSKHCLFGDGRLSPLLVEDTKRILSYIVDGESSSQALHRDFGKGIESWQDKCVDCIPVDNHFEPALRRKLVLAQDKYGLLVPAVALSEDERPESCSNEGCGRPLLGSRNGASEHVTSTSEAERESGPQHSLPSRPSSAPLRDQIQSDMFSDQAHHASAASDLSCMQCQQTQGCKLCTVPSQYSAEYKRKLSAAAHTALSAHRDTAEDSTARHFLDTLIFASSHYISKDAMPDNTTNISRSDADVLVVSKHDMARPDFLPEKPCIVREIFEEPEAITPDFYAEVLEGMYFGRKMSVRQENAQVPDLVPVSDVTRLLRGEGDPRAANALSMQRNLSTNLPFFMQTKHFSLLHRLIKSCKAGVEGKADKQTHLTAFDVSSCEGFEILGFGGAFSGPHRDIMGGTWLRNLFGTKLWWIIDTEMMTEQDWQDFHLAGPEWKPAPGMAKALLLEPGDVLVMPHTVTPAPHAVLTLKTCLMTGGMFWDERCVKQLINFFIDTGKAWNTTNEPPPFELAAVVRTLQEYLLRDQQKNAVVIDLIEDMFKGQYGCNCEGKCGKECGCRKKGVRCTAFCTGHPSLRPLTKKDRACMDDPGGAEQVLLPSRKRTRVENTQESSSAGGQTTASERSEKSTRQKKKPSRR